MVLPYVPRARSLQESLMTDRCKIIRAGTTIYSNVPCRVHHSRLLTETPDPQDANTRSMTEFGWTIPVTYSNVEVGDTISKMDNTLSTIAGEVLKHDTWATAIRIWATQPKDAVQETNITLLRYDPIGDDWDTVGTYAVHVHFDRNQPLEIPVRYTPAGITLYKNGFVACDNMAFDPQPGDRFMLYGVLPCHILFKLPGQPQRIEASFIADVSGGRL